MSELEIIVSGEELKRKLNLKDGKPGPKGDKGDSIVGPPGKPGKNGSPDSPEDILKKIDGKVSYRNLKDKPDIAAIARKVMPNVASRDYDLHELKDVDVSGVTTEQSLKWNGTKWVPYTPTDVGGVWGAITGTLSDQTDLQTALDAKADDSTTISAGTGLTGGGSLGANRTLSLNAASIASLALADTSLQSGDNISELVNDAGYISSVSGDWTGTFDGQEGSYYLARANHTGTQAISTITNLQTELDGKVDENTAITGATKTKITYDAKGLVTAGVDATTADIADSSNRRYVTDAQLTVIGNTSGTNSGDVTVTDSSEIDFTLTGQDLTASLITGSIDVLKLDAGVQASLALADTAVQDLADLGITADATEINYIDGVTSAIQTQLDGKQPLDADLTTLAGLTATTDNFIVSVASAWASRTPAQVRTTLGLVVGTDVQAWSANLDEYAAVNPTAAGLALLDDADASAQRTTLGLGTAATQNTGTSGANVPLLNAANTWSAVQTMAANGAPLTVNSTNSNSNKITLQNNGVTVGAFGTGTNLPLVVSDETGTQRFFFTNTGRISAGLNAANTPTSSIDIRHNDLQTTPAQAAGIAVLNATNATAGVPVQISPAFRWYSTAWDTDNSVARQIEWYNYSVPVSADIVSANLTWSSSVAGAALSSRMVLTSDGRLGLGTTSPNANAILDLTSTTRPFMPPRMTTTQRDAVSSPTAGMVIYNSTTAVLNFYNGSAWGAV